MEIYHEIITKFHDRIKGVMIRRLAYIRNEKMIQSYKEKINQLDVPFVTFH